MDINKLTYELIKDLVPEDFSLSSIKTKTVDSSSTEKRKKTTST